MPLLTENDIFSIKKVLFFIKGDGLLLNHTEVGRMDHAGRNFVPLAKGVFEQRYAFLVDELGLLPQSITSLREIAPRLCDRVKAKQRYDNLKRLGFRNPQALLNHNPFLLARSRKNVAEKFHLWQKEVRRCSPKVDFYDLCSKYPQIFSASIEKTRIIFALVKHIGRDVNAERLCHIVTVNLEAILIAHITYRCESIIALHTKARHIMRANRHTTLESKRRFIMERSEALPPEVWSLYHKIASR